MSRATLATIGTLARPCPVRQAEGANRADSSSRSAYSLTPEPRCWSRMTLYQNGAAFQENRGYGSIRLPVVQHDEALP